MSMRKIYRQIAREHGVSAGDVRREIQAAINEAYREPNEYARQIKCKGSAPTPEEFIAYAAVKLSAARNETHPA